MKKAFTFIVALVIGIANYAAKAQEEPIAYINNYSKITLFSYDEVNVFESLTAILPSKPDAKLKVVSYTFSSEDEKISADPYKMKKQTVKHTGGDVGDDVKNAIYSFYDSELEMDTAYVRNPKSGDLEKKLAPRQRVFVLKNIKVKLPNGKEKTMTDNYYFSVILNKKETIKR